MDQFFEYNFCFLIHKACLKIYLDSLIQLLCNPQGFVEIYIWALPDQPIGVSKEYMQPMENIKELTLQGFYKKIT